MKNYQKMSIAQDTRVELYDSLTLMGAEVSINHLPAGARASFVHSYKQNEETYDTLLGKGFITIDGERIELQAGNWSRIAPDGKRQISAASDSPIGFICIQARVGSLEGYIMTNGVAQ